MSEINPLVAKPLLTVGPLVLTETVITTWALMLVLAVLSATLTRNLRLEPGTGQAALEGVIGVIE